MTTPSISGSMEILLVEDSPTDILMTQEAFEQAGFLHRLHVVEDGAEALAFLGRQGRFAMMPRPDLILLDLNLPKKNGQEVLAELKGDDSLKFIPVIILTTSKADEDVLKSYGYHANGYITKPVAFTSFVETIRTLGHFWFNIVVLPPR